MDTKSNHVILRRNEVEARTGLARATIYGMIRTSKFPAPIKLTESGRAVGWLESDITEFLQSRINAARPNSSGVA